MKKRFQGSITIFLAVLLMIVISVVFALLEVSRFWSLDQKAEINSVMTANSVLSEYDKSLWQAYDLLFFDGGYRSDLFQLERIEQSALSHAEANLSDLQAAAVEISSYGLVTDQGGRAFIIQAAKAMESQFTEEMLEDFYELVTKEKHVDDKGVEVNETTKEIELRDSPIDTVETMKKKGILSLVAGEDISTKEIDITTTLSKRNLENGTIVYAQSDISWGEKILFRKYLEEHFLDFTKAKEQRALDYEMEYLVIGCATDCQNLQGVLSQLLLIREVSNLQYLRCDVEKQELILASATALAAATLSPELVPAYKAGIMAAWAYAESVSDLRLLLDGQSVKLIKTKEQWHTDIKGLAEQTTDIKQDNGYSYQEYLQVLLWTKADTVLAYRAMDLIEKNLGVNMNCHLYRVDGQMKYQGTPLFTSFITIGRGAPGRYMFSKSFSANYLKE